MSLKNYHVTNNIAESFNYWIMGLMSLSYMRTLDELRSKLMNILTKRFAKRARWKTDFVQNVVNRMNNIMGEARWCHLFVACNDKYMVKEKSNHYIVNLAKNHVIAGCGVQGKHVVVAITYRGTKLRPILMIAFQMLIT